ncbi:hypothetical protein Tco_0606356 [Tanacetum coccineum]
MRMPNSHHMPLLVAVVALQIGVGTAALLRPAQAYRAPHLTVIYLSKFQDILRNLVLSRRLTLCQYRVLLRHEVTIPKSQSFATVIRRVVKIGYESHLVIENRLL